MTTKKSKGDLIITRIVNAPRELVFKAWTDPKHMAQWWGPKTFTNPVCDLDVRLGGAFRIVMKSPDGNEYPCEGVYREIVEPERLVFTNLALDKTGNRLLEGLTTVTFAKEGNKTKLTMETHMTPLVPEAVKMLEGMEAGWTQSLVKLDELMEPNTSPIIVERTFNAPVARVWKALTTKDEIAKWSFEMKAFKPEVGFEFEFFAEKDNVKYHHRCKVTEAVPNKRLAYTWRYEGHPGNSLVTIELAEEGKKTKLKLTHTGIETFPQTGDFDRKNFVEGWTKIIGTWLKETVETN